VAALAPTERRAAERASELESELQSANAQVRKLKTASEVALEASRRELAAERSTTAALADCKRQLDGELATIRAQLATTITRAGAAEQRNIELELDVAVADSVRSFAVEAEREIAQLRQQLHETRSALSDLAVERDRLAAFEHEAKSERAPTNPLGQPTMRYDVPGLEELFKRTAALEDWVVELERENAQLREALARAKRRIR
jgi:chromosome segregation ATPase